MSCQKFLISPVILTLEKQTNERHTYKYKIVKTFTLDKGNQVTRALKLVALIVIVCCEYWGLGNTKTKVGCSTSAQQTQM